MTYVQLIWFMYAAGLVTGYGVCLYRENRHRGGLSFKRASKADAATKRCTCKQHRTDGRQATEPGCPVHDAKAEHTV